MKQVSIKVDCRLDSWKETNFYFNLQEGGVLSSAYCDENWHPCAECDKCREVAEKKLKALAGQ